VESERLVATAGRLVVLDFREFVDARARHEITYEMKTFYLF
jgi:hypothetical protein